MGWPETVRLSVVGKSKMRSWSFVSRIGGYRLCMVRWTGLIVLTFSLAACSLTTTTTSADTSSGTAAPTTSTSIAPSTTTSPINDSAAICLTGDLAFVDNGLVAAVGEDVGDATQIEQIRMASDASCERVTIEFTNEGGAPAASIGPTGISVLDFAGVVRIVVPPEIATTAVADTLLEGDLVDTATVIRDDSGGLIIDIRGVEGTPILARGFATTSPASLVIDVTSNTERPEIAGVTASATAIVVSPVPGPNLYPITVDGYAAPGLGSISVQVGTEDSTDVAMTVTLEGRVDAWQAFRTSIEDGLRSW